MNVNTELSKRQLLIASAVKRVLKPIVKLMLANNLTYTFAIDVIKGFLLKLPIKIFLFQISSKLTRALV